MRLIQTSFWISNNADNRRTVANLDAVVEQALYVYRRVCFTILSLCDIQLGHSRRLKLGAYRRSSADTRPQTIRDVVQGKVAEKYT